ncbi:hypothetical protein BLL52_1495 [Rhodoferax antarcticus ANT.BR]|uniref:Uncharacterized protein n=1 Tax=Rhodoferax antarcticus ANT.BR TaxID=1111071 RepID=A0A1Q8YGM0_9BURK|nr:hypothetical protein BLL52_1495 [Rhodoferax antarcticus ANT.BR]
MGPHQPVSKKQKAVAVLVTRLGQTTAASKGVMLAVAKRCQACFSA